MVAVTEAEKYRRCYQHEEYRCGPARLEVGRALIESLGGSYLDVGCGRGELVAMARERGIEAYGLELVQDLCDERVVFCGSAAKIPFGTGMIDTVSCLDMLEHLPTEAEAELVLSEIFRVARRRVFLTTNDRPSVYLGMELHLLRRPLEWWRERIEREGWAADFTYGPPHADWQWNLTRIE